jgi:hypothetical protein
MNLTIIEYDKQKRVVYIHYPDSNITYYYKYKKSERIITIINKKNRSNYKTIIKQNINDNNYTDFKIKQFGDIYNVEILFDSFGNEILTKRVNKIKKTNYIKQTFRNKKGEAIFWFENYNGEESIGFKVNLNKIINNNLLY